MFQLDFYKNACLTSAALLQLQLSRKGHIKFVSSQIVKDIKRHKCKESKNVKNLQNWKYNILLEKDNIYEIFYFHFNYKSYIFVKEQNSKYLVRKNKKSMKLKACYCMFLVEIDSTNFLPLFQLSFSICNDIIHKRLRLVLKMLWQGSEITQLVYLENILHNLLGKIWWISGSSEITGVLY